MLSEISICLLSLSLGICLEWPPGPRWNPARASTQFLIGLCSMTLSKINYLFMPSIHECIVEFKRFKRV